MSGISVTSVSGGLAEQYLDWMEASSPADCDADGEPDEYCSNIVAISVDDGSIPASTDQLLLTVAFRALWSKSISISLVCPPSSIFLMNL